MLRILKRVVIEFSPTDPKAASARELLHRVGSDAAKIANPDLQVSLTVDEQLAHGRSVVGLHFVDDQQQTLLSAEYKIGDILSIIKQKSSEMELRSVMKDVGYDPFKAKQ
eukprot:jgi/Chrzof1/728/Cz01g26160.t1